MPPSLTFLKLLLITLPFVVYAHLKPIWGHWLLNDALNFFISINLKFKDEIETLTSFDNIMKKDASVAFELTYLASNIKKKVYGVLDSFLSFFFNMKGKKNP